jgi:hypothetical protein
LNKLSEEKSGGYSIMGKACILLWESFLKQFEYLTHAPDFIREARKDSRGQLVDYDELQELGRQGWELVIAQQGGKWVFKRLRGRTNV